MERPHSEGFLLAGMWEVPSIRSAGSGLGKRRGPIKGWLTSILF